MEPLKFMGIKLAGDGFGTAQAVVTEHVLSLRSQVPDSDFQKAMRRLGDDIYERGEELRALAGTGVRIARQQIDQMSCAEQIFAMGQAHSIERMTANQRNIANGRDAAGINPSATQRLINETGWKPQGPAPGLSFDLSR